jgi:tetratricopeptide (TPR) repeat protein
MNESPETDEGQAEAASQINNVSGGVNLEAQQVTIGGDVVGRDKVTQNTWIRQFIMSPWAWIGGMVILVIGLTLVAGINNIGPLQTLFPQPTRTAFAAAAAGQSLIIVADFEDRSGGKYQGIDPAQYIYEQLTAQAKKDNLNIRIERLRTTVDDTTVRPTGETYSATLVLWGWYDALSITPRAERIQTRSDYRSTEEGKHLSLVDPAKVEFNIATDLPSQSTYLVLFVLGLDAYADPARNDVKAMQYFSGAIESLPANMIVTVNPAEAYSKRGNIYFDRGDYDRALGDYNAAIRLKPDYANAYNNRGNVYNRQGEYAPAIADYDRAIQLDPGLVEAYFNRGFAYNDKGESDRALADFDQAVQLKPHDANAYAYRGLAYYFTGDYDRAIADYNQAIQLNPEDSDTYINRGLAYYQKGDDDQAIADFNQAVELNPDDAYAYDGRGAAYDDKGEYDHAIADYDKAIQLQPDYPNIYNDRGVTYNEQGAHDRAIADFDKAIQLKPDYAIAYVNRGNAYHGKGDTAHAIADYTKAIQFKPNLVEAYINRGITYRQKGEKDKAIVDFKQVLELSQDPKMRQSAQDALKSLGAQ